MNRAAILALVLVPSLLILVAVGAPGATPEGVPWVKNGAEPRDGIRTFTLGEQWRAGGENDDVFFGNVLQVLPGPDGTVHVLDSQQTTVFVFTDDGRFVGTLGGRGEGPTEVNNINSIIEMPDGSVGLGQVLPGKLVMVDAQGDPVGTIGITDPDAKDSGFVLLMGGQAQRETLLLTGMRWRMDDAGKMAQISFLRLYDRQGQALQEFLRQETVFDTSHFVITEKGYDFVWSRSGYLPDGRIYLAPERNRYRDQDLRPERIGEPGHHPGLPQPQPLGRREGERPAAARGHRHELRPSAQGCGNRGHRSGHHRGLRAPPEGGLWVRTSRGDHSGDGVLTTLDIFDAKGEFVAQHRLEGPGDPVRDGIHFLPGNRLVVVTGALEAYRREQTTAVSGGVSGEEVPLEVVCYSW